MRCRMRFSSRAPYSALVPFSSRNLRDRAGTSSRKARSPSRRSIWSCKSVDLLIQDRRQRRGVERLVGHHRIDPIDELRRKVLAHRRLADALQLVAAVRRLRAGRFDSNPNSGRSSRLMSRAPRLLVRKMMVFSKFTSVLSPSRSVALSKTPSSSRTSDCAAFSISSKSTIERSHALARRAVQLLLRQQRLRLAMSQVSGRRSQQFRHFMFHLVLAAIHFAAASSDCRAARRPAPPRF